MQRAHPCVYAPSMHHHPHPQDRSPSIIPPSRGLVVVELVAAAADVPTTSAPLVDGPLQALTIWTLTARQAAPRGRRGEKKRESLTKVEVGSLAIAAQRDRVACLVGTYRG